MKKASQRYRTIFVSLMVLLFGCTSDSTESDEYQIISEVLNHSFGHQKDDSNGLGWVDLSKTYSSLLVLNHTRLRESDIQLLSNYISYNNLTDFSIKDFQEYKEWDIEKIIDFNRYELEIMTDQSISSPYIGMVQISSVVFNMKLNEALIYTSFLCTGNGDCGADIVYHLKKEEKWKIVKVETLSVS
ncbi:hypothetical protein J0X14_05065 [Muricauda sp. CAU 1633]|uniref:hypothetical protein n=1 Tax=Allomuricauda sp. CAU 1633 TaxID=2816036 RepID=UPI001A8E0DE9|nr:hypothetical protein [Muricauda sp. CAU 1633]MBO0321656.1 hypothetical protein [Muricauda sp. CAU 1633]